MEIFEEAPKSFDIDRRSPLASKLKSSISHQLTFFLGDYSDDILAEYITVLVCNGKNQIQAKDDLEAFLGERSGAFVSWLWGHMFQYEHACRDASPSSCGVDRDLRSNRSGEVHAHLNAYTGTSMTKDDNYFHTTRVPSNDMRLSEVTEICRIPFAPSDRLGNNKEQSRKHRTVSCEAVDMAGELGCALPVITGTAESFEHADEHKLIVSQNENGLACQEVSKFPTRERASKSLEPSSAEREGNQGSNGREIYAANVRNPSSTLVDVPCQRKMSRGSVWDRLGKPHEEISVVSDKPLDAYVGDVVKKRHEAEDQLKAPLPAHNENFDQRMMHGVHVLDKSSEADGYPDDRNHEQKASTIVKPHTENNIRQKRYFSDLSSDPNHFSASSVDQNCVDGHLNKRSQDSNKLNSSAEQVKEVRRKLQQIEMDMSKLRSKQLGLTKEGQPRGLTSSGVFKCSKEDVNSRTVFVSNVHFAVTKEVLSSHFAKCGAVSNIIFMNNMKGSAYITFASKDSVEKAVSLNGSSFSSRFLKVVRKGEEAILTTTKPPLGAVKLLMHQKPAPEHGKTSLKKPFNPPRVHHHLQWRRSHIPAPPELSQASTSE